jgi:chemotaxis protein CheC
MDPRGLGELHLDALRETANIGAGHAATALSRLTGRRVMVSVPEVSVLPLENVGGMLGDPGDVVAAVIVKVEGDVQGRTLQVFAGSTAARFVSYLLNAREPEFPSGFGDLERSAMREIGNVIVGAYLNALSSFTGMSVTMSVPAFAIDMAAAILMSSYLNFGSEEDVVLSIGTSLGIDGVEDLSAHFLLIPEEDSLKRILQALHVA